MLKMIKQFFSQPVFPNDPTKTRLARILHTLVISLTYFMVLAFPALLFIYIQKIFTTIIIITAVGLLLAINVLSRRGYLRAASLVYIFMMWGAATTILYVGSGTSSPALGLYIAMTVTAGILLGIRWALIVATVNTLIVFAAALLEINNFPFPHLFPEPPLTRWFNFSMFLFLTITPVYLILTGLSEALTSAQQEIENRKKIELLLRESERKYRDITDNIPGLVFQFRAPHNDSGYLSYVSPRGLEIFDFSINIDSPDWGLGINIHPEDKATFLASINQAITNKTNWNYEGRLLTNQEKIKWIEAIASPVSTEDELIFDGLILDITQRKQLEEQISQSRKMEALGQLAGGIAHDFNNMLTPILAYVEIGMMKLPESDDLYKNLQEVRKAAERASRLTHQILAFSRRQVLEMRVLNLNTIVEDVQKMLKRTIGEDIELQIALSPNLPQIKADKGQLEQILVNLAVNARDAMPDGGKLIIETTKAFLDETVVDKHTRIEETGSYVMLAVSDTGHGMDEETQKKLFEPFFTTKDPGRGTGLGMATVLGIVKQHLGYIFVHSDLGKGTTFKIYLPCSEETGEIEKTAPENVKAYYGNETILIVEDEPMVRYAVQKMLLGYGYHVLEADTPAESVKLVSYYEGKIDLLLTDVVMPEMNGLVLYQKIAEIRPGLKVLYMSGYTDIAVSHEENLGHDFTLLQKPFTIHTLLQKVRQVLG